MKTGVLVVNKKVKSMHTLLYETAQTASTWSASLCLSPKTKSVCEKLLINKLTALRRLYMTTQRRSAVSCLMAVTLTFPRIGCLLAVLMYS